MEMYISNKNDINSQERYVGKESYFHASGAGLCTRKHYFATTDAPKTNPSDLEGLKRMRLGTVVHSEYEASIREWLLAKKESKTKKELLREGIYNNTYYKALYNTLKNLYPNLKDIKCEEEILLEDLNVRGFYDFLVVADGETDGQEGLINIVEQYHLYDLKTIGSFPYKLKFGRNPTPDPDLHHELQLGTYGLAIEKKYGRIDSMRLFYYKKDNSFHKFKEVSYHYLRKAETYWYEVNEKVSRGLPPLEEGISPVYPRWECKYCVYLNHCNKLKDKGK